MVELLLQAGADVNALNGDRETALHGAAHFAHLGAVKMLLKYKADTNICSCHHQRIPLQEVQVKNDHQNARQAILHLLKETSPETLYSVLFAGTIANSASTNNMNDNNNNATHAWLEHMFRLVKSLPTCKIFYTIIKAAEKLELRTGLSSREWTERAFVQVMRHFNQSAEDLYSLSTMVQHAVQEGDVSTAVGEVLQDFCRREPTLSSSHYNNYSGRGSGNWNMRKAIYREILSFRPLRGIDGKVASIRQCLQFFTRSMSQMNAPGRTDSEAAKRNAIMGIMGVVLNAILLRNHNSMTNSHVNNPRFDQFVSKFTDLLNFDHMKQVMQDNSRDWGGRRKNAVEELTRGYESHGQIWQDMSPQSSAWLENGFFVLGLCSAIVPAREMSFSSTTVQMGTRAPVGQSQHYYVPNNNSDRNVIRRGTASAPSWQQERHAFHRGRQGDQTTANQAENLTHGRNSWRNASIGSTGGQHSSTVAPFLPETASQNTTPSTDTGGTSRISREMATSLQMPTNLHWAVVEGDLHKVIEELDVIERIGNADVNATDSLNRSPLDLAALSGQRDIFEVIQEQGGQRRWFKTDQDMHAVMSYASDDMHSNRLGLLRTYRGSTRASLRSADSSITSGRGSRSTLSAHTNSTGGSRRDLFARATP